MILPNISGTVTGGFVMKKLNFLFVLVSFFVVLGLSLKARPLLSDCGELLPKGAHYSMQMHGSWDTRGSSGSASIGMTLTDEVLDISPEEIPVAVKPFHQCVMGALGLPENDT